MKLSFADVLLQTVLVALASTSCSSDDARRDHRVCIPGEQRACACVGSNLRQGVQVCNAEGTALGSCTGCDSVSQAGNPGSISATGGQSATTTQSGGGVIIGGATASGSAGASSVAVADRSCAPFASTYDPNFTAEEIFIAEARLACDKSVRCCLMPATMHEDCVKYGASYGEGTVNRIRAGMVTVDLSSYKACYDARVAQTGCNESTPPECDALHITAARHVGESCLDHGDCIDSYCDNSADACGGVCATYRQLGQACQLHQLCNPGLRCGVDPNSSPTQTPAEGEPAPPSVQHVCREYLPEGAPCESQVCAEGLLCSGSVGSQICAARLPSGAPCDREYDLCERGFECTGTCTPRRSNLTLGERCTWANTCGVDTYCRFDSGPEGRCAQPLPLGAPCIDEADECANGARCNAASTCAIARQMGEPCSSDSDCDWSLECNQEKKCARFAKLGEACGGRIGCLDSFCRPDGDAWCMPRLREGESCVDSDECESRRCVDSICCG